MVTIKTFNEAIGDVKEMVRLRKLLAKQPMVQSSIRETYGAWTETN